jgi:hypothetical protein
LLNLQTGKILRLPGILLMLGFDDGENVGEYGYHDVLRAGALFSTKFHRVVSERPPAYLLRPLYNTCY